MNISPAILTFIAFGCTAAWAEDTAPAPSGGTLAIELNGAKNDGAACRLTFVVTNSGPQPVDSTVLETVLFDAAGAVDRLTLFDFGTLPPGRQRVRQFQVEGLACDNLGKVLINGANTCLIDGAPSDFCARAMELTSRLGVELLG